MLSPGRGSSVIDLIESNADDDTSSTQQTDPAHSTNGFHSQPPETKSVSDDSTNDQPSSTSKSKPCKDFSATSSSSHPSTHMNKYPSVLHDSHLQHNLDTTHCLFQNLSLLSTTDNKKSDTPMPSTRGKTTGPRALLSTTSSESNPENRIKKRAVRNVSRKPKKHTQFKHYRHPSGITAITKAMETLETTVDDDVESPTVKDSVNHRLVTLKYRSSRTAAASASPTGEHTTIDSSSSSDD